MVYFVETSAKSGDNVDKLFVDVAKIIYTKYKDKLHRMIEGDDSSASRTNSDIGGTGSSRQRGAHNLRPGRRNNRSFQKKRECKC